MSNKKVFAAGMAAGAFLTCLAAAVIRKIGQEALYELDAHPAEDDLDDFEDEYYDEDLEDEDKKSDCACGASGCTCHCDEDEELANAKAPVNEGPVNWDDVFAGAVQEDGFF